MNQGPLSRWRIHSWFFLLLPTCVKVYLRHFCVFLDYSLSLEHSINVNLSQLWISICSSLLNLNSSSALNSVSFRIVRENNFFSSPFLSLCLSFKVWFFWRHLSYQISKREYSKDDISGIVSPISSMLTPIFDMPDIRFAKT